MVNRTSLMQRRNHLAVRLAEGDEPRTDFGFGGGGGDHEVEAVGKLLEDDHRAREQSALPVDLGADVLADGSPPDVAARDERRGLRALMQLLLEADPLEKAVHALNLNMRWRLVFTASSSGCAQQLRGRQRDLGRIKGFNTVARNG